MNTDCGHDGGHGRDRVQAVYVPHQPGGRPQEAPKEGALGGELPGWPPGGRHLPLQGGAGQPRGPHIFAKIKEQNDSEEANLVQIQEMIMAYSSDDEMEIET